MNNHEISVSSKKPLRRAFPCQAVCHNLSHVWHQFQAVTYVTFQCDCHVGVDLGTIEGVLLDTYWP